MIKTTKALTLSLIVALSTAGVAISGNLSEKLELRLDMAKTAKAAPVVRKAPPSTADILLVMPNAGADRDETFDALKEAHGTIVGTIGEGSLTTLIIKTEKGKLDETEKKLSSDKHFTAVQRDMISESFALPTASGAPNDPYLGWELPAVGVTPRGWTMKRGAGVVVAIADSGCQSTNPDLAGKCYAGFDAVNNREGNATTDIDASGSHGTACATSAAASTNNGRLSAAPAGDAYIYPIKISSQSGQQVFASETSIIRAIYQAGTKGIRVLNISYGMSDARYSFANANAHPVMHQYLKWYHDQRNGLTFFAAGNENQFDPNPRLPYFIMVSALNSRYGITSFSNWGNPIWFIAPGESVTCSNRDGRVVRMNGTSFASPMVAGIAAVILSKKPNLTNTQVEQILVRSCGQSGKWLNTSYGYGLPNVERALNSF